jgi:hypothetical protein
MTTGSVGPALGLRQGVRGIVVPVAILASLSCEPPTDPPPPTLVPSASLSTIEAERSSVAVCDGMFITVHVRDQFGDPYLSPVTVVFTQTGNAGGLGVAESQGNGVYRASFIASNPGSSTIGATINGVAVTSPAPTIAVTPAPGS